MKDRYLLSASIPLITREFAEHVKAVFRPIDVKPNTSLSEVMFAAGQQQVVEYIVRNATERMVVREQAEEDTVQEPEPEIIPIKRKSLFRRAIETVVQFVQKIAGAFHADH